MPKKNWAYNQGGLMQKGGLIFQLIRCQVGTGKMERSLVDERSYYEELEGIL
jgi:hypothetical protein